MDVDKLSESIVAYKYVISASVEAFNEANLGNMLLEPTVACAIVETASEVMQSVIWGRMDGGKED